MSTLFYIHDPMCSWCWGFSATWHKLQRILPPNIRVKYLLGGLAVDSDALMPISMQSSIKQTWRNIQEEIPGTEFNFEFWAKNSPRRSTYPACRAVIAARIQSEDFAEKIIEAIQHAYYLNAANPSNNAILIEIAKNMALDINKFKQDLSSPQTQSQLDNEINKSIELGAQGFPSLILKKNNKNYFINIDYVNADNIVNSILSITN